MQRRHDEVAGQRGLHRDASRLDVADLADEDRVGVLAQDRAQTVGERDARLLVRLDLVDRGEEILDGILDRDDVDAVVVDRRHRGVQRRRLARSGRSRADHHAERRTDELAEVSEGVVEHPELFQADERPASVEEPEYAFLAEHGRGRRRRGRRAAGPRR